MKQKKFVKPFIFSISILLVFLNILFCYCSLSEFESAGTIILNLSVRRLLILIALVLLSIIVSVFLYQIIFKKGFGDTIIKKLFPSEIKRKQLFSWILLGTYLVFILLEIPNSLSGKYSDLWNRFSPFLNSIFLLLILFDINLYLCLFDTCSFNIKNFLPNLFKQKKWLSWFLVVLIVFQVLLSLLSSKTLNPDLWNSLGAVPILVQYVYLIFGIWFFATLFLELYGKKNKISIHPVIIFAFLWFHSIAIINSQGIPNNEFLSEPSPPTWQYFPYSDAQSYDMSAYALLNGLGLWFGNPTDKPYVESYYAFLHFFKGNNYEDMMSLHIAIMSLIPGFLFLIGKELKSKSFGVLLAIMGILFEVTSFQASGSTLPWNIHWKLIMSEPVGQLYTVIATYFTIKWLNNPQNRTWICLSGAFIGLGSFSRPQCIFFFPILFILALFIKSQTFKEKLTNLAFSTFGFFSTTLPWTIYAKWKYGYLMLIGKFEWILRTRFGTSTQIFHKLAKSTEIFFVNSDTPFFYDSFLPNLKLLFSHFANNLIKGIMIIPYSLKMQNVHQTVWESSFWKTQAGQSWNGGVTEIFYISLFIFIFGLLQLIRKKGVAGIAPILFFLSFSLALSLSSTSSSRYIVPIIFIILIYYFYGLYEFFQWVSKKIVGQSNPQFVQNNQHSLKTNRKQTMRPAIYVCGILFLFGSILPAVDHLIPKSQNLLLSVEEKQNWLNDLLTNDDLPLKSNPDFVLGQNSTQVYYGKMLYPRIIHNENNNLLFEIFMFNNQMQWKISTVISPQLASTIDDFDDLEKEFLVLSCAYESEQYTYLLESADHEILLFDYNNWQFCINKNNQ